MRIFVELIVMLGVAAIWGVLVALAMRVFGINVRIRFWPKSTNSKRDELRDRGKVLFVFVQGVVLWGWGVFLAITTFNYVTVKYFHESSDYLSLGSLVLRFIIFSAAGIGFGLYVWARSQQKISSNSASPRSV